MRQRQESPDIRSGLFYASDTQTIIWQEREERTERKEEIERRVLWDHKAMKLRAMNLRRGPETQTAARERLFQDGAGGRTRTDTPIKRRILNPLRLPIPPHRQWSEIIRKPTPRSTSFHARSDTCNASQRRIHALSGTGRSKTGLRASHAIRYHEPPFSPAQARQSILRIAPDHCLSRAGRQTDALTA